METLIILTMLFTTGAGFAIPLPLGEMIETADTIVVGTIEQVSSTTFTLKVEDVLAGKVATPRIEIEKFRTRPESPRWAPHCPGQQVILFLSKDRRILGRLGEGEIPLDANFAYFHSRYFQIFAPDWYEVHGRRIYIQRFDRKLTIDAIRHYRTPDAAYRKRSKLHEFLGGEKGR